MGAVNYKKSLVIDVVSSILPAGMEAWRVVASRYWTLSSETHLRDAADIKRFFMSKCVNLTKKPTGESAPAQLTRRANEVYEDILRKENAHSYGAAEDSSEQDESDDGVDEEQDFDSTTTPTLTPLTIIGRADDEATNTAPVQFTPAYEGVRKRKTPPSEIIIILSLHCTCNARPSTKPATFITLLSL